MSDAPPMLLVTGATGFAMTHVLRDWLVHHPAGEAVCVDRAAPAPVVQDFLASVAERVVHRLGDVRDEALWNALGQRWRFTHIVHGAVVTSINRLARDPQGNPDLAGAIPALEANILGTARALAFAARQPALRRFVYVSSDAIHGGRPSPGDEDECAQPANLYGISKHAAELLCHQAARQFGVPALAVRPCSVYGELDRDTGARHVTSVPGTLLRVALAGEEMRLAGLDAVGNYIHAGDVASAIIALLDCERPRHAVYNVALPHTTSLRELAGLVTGLVAGARWREVAPQAAHLALRVEHDIDTRPAVCDLSRLVADCGWRPRPLAKGLAVYRDWLRRYPT